jgi:hypothetical protein
MNARCCFCPNPSTSSVEGSRFCEVCWRAVRASRLALLVAQDRPLPVLAALPDPFVARTKTSPPN